MDRSRALILVLLLMLMLGLAPGAMAQSPRVPVERRPYAIRVHLAFAPSARFDEARRALVVEEWLGLVNRFVGAPWAVEVVGESGPISAIRPDELTAAVLMPIASGADKAWAIRVEGLGSGFVLEGRELDVTTGELGEVHRREVEYPGDLARGLLGISTTIFAPSAIVGESSGGGVAFLVQAGLLPASSPIGEPAPVGTVFRVVRLFLKEDDSVEKVVDVPYSYFRVESLNGATARCEIIKGIGDPLTSRYSKKNRLVALGIKPASAPTRLRFLLKGDRQPAAGYKLTARSILPGAKATEVGTTDRDGRIELRAGFADGLVMLRLLAGNEEPMADIPVMPGETRIERSVVFEPRPLTLDLEARLDALRDAIIDLVADRARIEFLMKLRADSDDWPRVEEAAREFRKLPPRERLETRLDRMVEEAEQLEAERKTLVITKYARNQIDDTKALIARYLDDEKIKSYEDAVERAKVEAAQVKAKGKAKTAAAPRPGGV